MRVRNAEELNVPGVTGGIQHAIEHRADQEILKGIQSTNRCHEDYRRQDLPPVGQRIAEKARQLPHGTPARDRPQSRAAGRIAMECKALFYLSFARKYAVSGCRKPGSQPQRTRNLTEKTTPYFGLSLCTTFTR